MISGVNIIDAKVKFWRLIRLLITTKTCPPHMATLLYYYAVGYLN